MRSLHDSEAGCLLSEAASAGDMIPGGVAPGRVEEFDGAGGQRLAYRVIAADGARHRLLYLHGIESHGAWFLPAAWRLRDRGCTTYLLDRRGSGLNLGERPGDAPGADCLLEDIRRFRRHVADPEIHVVGLSWGGKLAVAAALDRPERVRSLVLVTPGLRARVDLTLPSRIALVLGLFAGGRNRLKVPIDPEMFTMVPHWLDFVRRDPWRLRRVTGRLLLAGRALDHMIKQRIGELRLPVLLFVAGRDRIVDNVGVLEVLAPLPRGQLRLHRFADANHLVQLERTEPLVAEIAAFLDEATASC